MRKLILITLITTITGLFTSCKESVNQASSEKVSSVDSLVNHFRNHRDSLPNKMQKDEYKKMYLDSVDAYYKSKNFLMGNIKLKVESMENTVIGETRAFYVKYSDKNNNQYFTEFDYPENDSNLYKNPAYLLLKDIPENTDTTFSMFFMGGAEWDNIYDDNLRLHVVPFPVNYNFDSSRAANKKLKP